MEWCRLLAGCAALTMVACRPGGAGDEVLDADAEADADATDEGTPSTQSTTGGEGNEGGSAASTTESEAGTTAADPPWEPELDESCGDGVIEPGILCYLPVTLPDRGGLGGVVGVDLDGDGDDELAAYVTAVVQEPGTGGFLQLDFDGAGWVELDFEQPASGSVNYAAELGFDHDGDGRSDVLIPHSEGRYKYRLRGDTLLGPSQTVILPSPEPDIYIDGGFHPLDLEGDGFPEFVGSIRNLTGLLHQTRVFRRVQGEWVADGPAQMPFLPCGALEQTVRADFDNDGDEDVLALDSGRGCDPFPAEYDPRWFRYNVYLNDRDSDTLVLLDDAPMGGMPYGPLVTRDFDEDGNADALLEVIPEDGASAVLLSGRGDGTFAEPELVYIDALPEKWQLVVVANLFGTHDRSLLVRHDGSFYAVESSRADAEAIPIMPSVPHYGHGDFNGDGLLDFVVRHPDDSGIYLVMISWP